MAQGTLELPADIMSADVIILRGYSGSFLWGAYSGIP